MAPPASRKCEIQGCDYEMPEGINTFTDQREELQLHLTMVHQIGMGSGKVEAARRNESGDVEDNEEEDTENSSFGNRYTAKLERPTLTMPSSQKQWSLFKHRWNSTKMHVNSRELEPYISYITVYRKKY